MRIEYHRTLIADRVRNQAFHDALARTIKKGETTVADIGAGTGLIGLMAASLGAREVILYEAAEVAGVADAILKANAAHGCHLMPCHSTEMEDPPRVDLVVSETLGNYALEENIVATLADAGERHLKDGGVIIPSRIRQFVAPVITDRIHRELTVWDDVGFALDLSAARTMSFNNVYVRTLVLDDLLEGGAAAHMWDEVILGSGTDSAREGEATWRLDHAQTVYGFAYWWEAELIPDVVLSTAPDAPRTHWEQLYFPLLEPMILDAGESVRVMLNSTSSEDEGTHLAWTALRLDRDGAPKTRQAMDLDKGWIP